VVILIGATQQWIVRFFARRSRAINTIGGILLVGVGIFDLINNWP
jgi:cytochrome c biogenesis protein CcdA